MAAEGVCPFPLPPTQYYKLYTDENVENKAIPEPPPALNGTYSMFGASFEVNENHTQIKLSHRSNKPRLHERFFARAGDAIFSNFVTSPARDENCKCSHP